MCKDTKLEEDILKCPQCTARCWFYETYHKRGLYLSKPCSGKMHVTEDYPESYTHYCEAHGHPDD